LAKIQAIRGMNDILPDQSASWQYVERVLGTVLGAYGYREIRLPIVEKTELFQRSIGEVTDIVEKEMYTFEDRNGDSLTLRRREQPVVSGRQRNMAFFSTRSSGCGTPGRCSGMSGPRRGVTASSTRLAWNALAWPGRTLTRKRC